MWLPFHGYSPFCLECEFSSLTIFDPDAGDCNARQRGVANNIGQKSSFSINHTVICCFCCCCWLRLGGGLAAAAAQQTRNCCWTWPAPAWAAGGEPLTSASADPSTPGYPRYPAPAAAATCSPSYGSEPRAAACSLKPTLQHLGRE